MKLVKQTTLYLQRGTSDKIYEVDLCELDPARFLVNFRYGRRGATLREGTKTTNPVTREEAEKLFDKLVSSKTDKGYSERDPELDKGVVVAEFADPVPPASEERPIDGKRELNAREVGVLNRLSADSNYSGKWKLSRAIWRAGEIGLVEAEPLLHSLVGQDMMTNYSIAWAMGRFGVSNSVPILERLAKDTAHPHVAQIATEALRSALPEKQRAELIASAAASLPAPLNTLFESDSPAGFQSAFLGGLGKEYDADLLNVLYYIDDETTRPTLLAALKEAPLEPPYFRPIRRIFKAAEMRGDGQVFGLLAYRFEVYKCKFRVPTYTWRGYKKPTLGENPEHAFSVQTRDYLRRRVWNTLNRLGQIEDSGFVPMAVGTLLPFTDDDAKPVRQDSRYDYQQRSYTDISWDVFGAYWAFNQLLYHNSPRYQPLRGKKSFRVSPNYEPGCAPPDEREEAFPELWRKQPKGLLHLLTESRCRPVHEFAVKSIRGCQNFLDELPLEVVKLLINSAYDVTVELGFELAVKRYDANNPDFELVLMLANCSLERARAQAKSWIEADRNKFFADNDFAFEILTSPYADSRAVGIESMYAFPSDETNVKVLAGRLIAFLQSALPEQSEIAGDVSNTLQRSTFKKPVSTLGEEVICDLLKSELVEVQVFAGSVVLSHETFAKTPTERVLRAMLDATHPPVRAMGIKVISNLDDAVLLENVDMLAGLSCHEHADIRAEVRPVVKRLVDKNSAFAKRMASELIRRLLTPGAPDGVPSHTSHIIREDLSKNLDHITSDIVFRLLKSRSAPAQEVGGYLLPTNVQPGSLSVAEIVKLTNQNVLTVRQAAWKMYDAEVPRIQAELATAVRILDSDWEDSRLFGFEFLKQKIDEQELTPEVLISICDSVREDVQQFGREMITRQFAKEHGPEYLLKLSEHPTASLQLFASNFLAEYGADNPDRIESLSPYFVSILSRVNKSRVAKDRVLEFLKTESAKNQASARTISGILDRISATCAIGDRATTIEAMLELHEAFPDIELPIELKPLEVR